MSTQTSFALVTGASQGLGKAFATELAQRGHNVLLTALPGTGLFQLCDSLENRYNITAHALACDLTFESEVQRLLQWIRENYAVHLLINNAGIGGTAAFSHTPFDFIDNVIQLNVRATVMLTHQLLPLLQRHRQAWVLNVASMAAFSPMGYKTVYPASKAFVRHFSRGLQEELKASGVWVSVVHPGPMATNPDCSRRIARQGWLGKAALLPPETLARKALDQLFKKKARIIIGGMNRFNRLLMWLVPTSIRLPLLGRIVQRELAGSTFKPPGRPARNASQPVPAPPVGHCLPAE